MGRGVGSGGEQSDDRGLRVNISINSYQNIFIKGVKYDRERLTRNLNNQNEDVTKIMVTQ